MRHSFIILVFAYFLCPSCSQDERPLSMDLSKRSDVSLKNNARAITSAYQPQFSHRVSYERHPQLVEHLRKETGLPVKQVFSDTSDEHVKMVGQGKIDISFSNPVAYVHLAHCNDAFPFARIVELYGRADFRGQIICRKDNLTVNDLQDCKGKRWYAVDPSSAGCYIFALGHFFDHGVRKEDLTEIAFALGPGDKSEKVALAVYAGKNDIGSVREGNLNVFADKLDVAEIRVVANTKWYLGWVYAARKGLDPRWSTG